MLNDITIVKCEVMSHLVRLRGKDTVQCAHCALHCIGSGAKDEVNQVLENAHILGKSDQRYRENQIRGIGKIRYNLSANKVNVSDTI